MNIVQLVLYYDVNGEANFGCNAIVALKCIGQKYSFNIVVSQLKMNTGLLRICFPREGCAGADHHVTVTSELSKYVNNVSSVYCLNLCWMFFQRHCEALPLGVLGSFAKVTKYSVTKH
ncbi:hypothetical protein OIU77_010565 [Salix suchowensis]|uniref:Uncharacterized protein n=1 Tax=Salix suchowensis TaxID=1278906 RepID=A0ABQ9A991_9ROSI|nr:hypothetical protein OIU77_010565 [Salix suchowensis]